MTKRTDTLDKLEIREDYKLPIQFSWSVVSDSATP